MTHAPTHLGIDGNGCLTEARVIDGQELCIHHDDIPDSDITLCDAGESGHLARERLHGETVAAPELVDPECLSAIRGLVLSRRLTDADAERVRAMLVAMPIRRSPHHPLLARCWRPRTNLTVYDAAYVALAELLDVPLVTAGAHIGRAPGILCEIEMLTA